MNEIGKMIADRRNELNLTLEEVGKAVGVGRSTVQRWESGLIRNMGRDKIAALAKVLELNPVDLVPEAVLGGMDLTETERSIVIAYRHADDGTKSAVRKLLDVEVKTPASTAG